MNYEIFINQFIYIFKAVENDLIKLLNEERALIENDIKILCKNTILLIDKTLLKEAKEVII
jgi:hypothetical protein